MPRTGEKQQKDDAKPVHGGETVLPDGDEDTLESMLAQWNAKPPAKRWTLNPPGSVYPLFQELSDQYPLWAKRLAGDVEWYALPLEMIGSLKKGKFRYGKKSGPSRLRAGLGGTEGGNGLHAVLPETYAGWRASMASRTIICPGI